MSQRRPTFGAAVPHKAIRKTKPRNKALNYELLGGHRYVATACFGGLVYAVCSASAQEALWLSSLNQDNAALRKREYENLPYTIRWGQLNLFAGASIAGDWNDNVNVSHFDPQEDYIVRPMGNLDVLWPVTELNALNFSLGLGYEAYIEHSAYDHFIVSPGSQLGWDIIVKDFKINLHDQFYYQEDPTVYGAVSGTARFGGFFNTVGVLGTWDLHDVVLSLGYDHFNFISSTSTYDYLNRGSDFFLFRAGLQVHPSASVGVELSGGPTAYDQHIMSDNSTFSAGAFATWQATEHINVRARGGYYWYFFSEEGLVGAGSTQTGYYVSLRINHSLRENISYSLDLGHEAFLGIYSALTEQWYAAGYANWHIIKNITLTTGLRYENATQPVDLLGQRNENYERLYADVQVSCPVKKKLTVSLRYRYWLKNSDFEFDNYQQNLVSVQAAYRF
jgi:hypothetical protein